ncbi:PfkB family carbohydrate kinase [Agromyces endophyticus]|uniref:carbohydrate kinase family protein n=1 Tax=Agromyces sp. H17E-10 TaxID=2932244 RepID=UPI001FCFD2B6|nr:PfkB family carbohydrate kinase [Agromyces sp. H17E-10]UOQ89915.1 PfkB family carbohydrate kinase [Agromyces sp. H17E-10]
MRSPADGAGAVAGPAADGGATGDGADASGRPLLAIVGDLVEDIVVWASEPVRDGTDTAARVFRTRGGSAANVAALAAPLVTTRFIGCVGPDAAGDALVSALEASGAETLVQRRGTTGAVVVIVDPAGERTMFPDRGASALLDGVEPDWLHGASWLHVPSYGFEREPARTAVLELIAEARRRGAGLSIDASSTGLLTGLGVDEVLDLYASLAPDVLFANETEAALLGLGLGHGYGHGDGYGLRSRPIAATIVVKHGPDPTQVFAAGASVATVPVDPVPEARDLTGAGDAFAAGYLASALGGADPAAAARAGHRLAARVITAAGAEVGVADP